MTINSIYNNPFNFINNLNDFKSLKLESPCYIISLVELEKQLYNFKNLFPKGTIFAYSYKTNYLKPIIAFLDSNSLLSEVVSPFEVDITKEYNIDPKNIIYNGPTKDFKSIMYVLSHSGLVQIDSLQDMAMINNCLPLNCKARVGIRLNLSSFDPCLKSRFGFDIASSQFKKLLAQIESNDNVVLESIHSHIADRSLLTFRKQFRAIESILKDNSVLHKLKYLNIGGGFPSILDPFLKKQISIDFDENVFTSEVGSFLANCRSITQNRNLSIIVEPGTRLVATTMGILGGFHAIKSNFQEDLIITNISRTDFGSLHNSLMFPLMHIPEEEKNERIHSKKKYKLCGYTCVEKDIIGIYEFANPKTGDLFLIHGVGSYSQVNKSPFIGPELPVFVYNGSSFKQVRTIETASNVTSRYI